MGKGVGFRKYKRGIGKILKGKMNAEMRRQEKLDMMEKMDF